MWSLTYLCSVFAGCASVTLFCLSTRIISDLPTIFARHFQKYEPQYITPMLTNLKNIYISTEHQHFASSVWCLNRIDGSKKCSFKNIFYIPQFSEHLIFVLNEHSIVSGVESVEALKNINLSTISNHSNCILKLVIIKSTENLLHRDFLVVDANTLIMKRFKPDNIMHVIHDDLLPLFLTFQELCHGDIEHCLSSYQLLFLDDYDEGPYFEWYKIFSTHIPIFIKRQNVSFLIRKSVVGLTQESIWFDYGFKTTQGPLLNSHFNGLFLKKFTSFISQRFNIKKEDQLSTLIEPNPVVFLNRMVNRKILNGDVIEQYIINTYAKVHKGKKVKVLHMDLLLNGTKSLISTLQHSNLLVGVHGSAMMLGIFMPQGSNIIEVFPYGIQPEIVSPLKALCSLTNVYYKYSFWVNTNESNSITHPEYPPLLGGIKHLPILEQQNIEKIKLVLPVKCCHNPLYLFRMFQDTLVDESFYSLLDKVLIDNNISLNNQNFSKSLQINIFNKWYFPPPVFNLTCECTHKELKLQWSYPVSTLTDVRFSVYVSNGFSVTTSVTHLNMVMLECEFDQLNKLEYTNNISLSVWIKAIEGSRESLDSYKECSHS